MSNGVWAWLPLILLFIMYILVFTRKGEMARLKASLKSNDWVTYLGVILASTVLASSVRAVGSSQEVQPVLTGIVFAMAAVFLVIAVARIRTGKPIVQLLGDERMAAVNAKSARNALFTTYAVFFAHDLVTNADSFSAQWLLIVLASGLSVLIGSTFVYYFWKP